MEDSGASILANVSANAQAMEAAIRVLATSSAVMRDACEETSHVSREWTFGQLATGPTAASCHACYLDMDSSKAMGLWAITSALEGGQVVLLGMKGTFSKKSLLERMCLYRMPLSEDIFNNSPHLKDRSLFPEIKPDNLTYAERVERMKHASTRLDSLYAGVAEHSVEDAVVEDVLTLKHVTDNATGLRHTYIADFRDVKDNLQVQKASFRKKHSLAEAYDPVNYIGYVQSYEIIVDDQKQTWRQSSLRVRIFDPQRDYRLASGVIFYSERDRWQERTLTSRHAGCGLNSRNPSTQLPAAGGEANTGAAAKPGAGKDRKTEDAAAQAANLLAQGSSVKRSREGSEAAGLLAAGKKLASSQPPCNELG